MFITKTTGLGPWPVLHQTVNPQGLQTSKFLKNEKKKPTLKFKKQEKEENSKLHKIQIFSFMRSNILKQNKHVHAKMVIVKFKKKNERLQFGSFI